MQKLLLKTGAVLILLLPSLAQSVDPVPAPADVVLELRTEGDQHQFHLGELIPIRFSYSAKAPGRYLWVGDSAKLAGGHSVEISCSPAAERVKGYLPVTDDPTFEQMLAATCNGAGVGGGVGSGSGDCDQQLPLSDTPLTFGVLPLNSYVRFRVPGTYACEASSAEVTGTILQHEKVRPALAVKSNPIAFTIVDDPAWAHSAAMAYAEAYDKLCRGNDIAEHGSLQCSDIAQRITYLDTTEALATEVKVFDGRAHGWETGFSDAIQQSSYPQEAVRLIASRMQEPDFQASTSVLQWLASSELRMEVPAAFQSGTPATYHFQAVEKLRKYVRLLGSSLSKKNSDVLAESAKTYRMFAEQKYCERQLIPSEEQARVLSGRP